MDDRRIKGVSMEIRDTYYRHVLQGDESLIAKRVMSMNVDRWPHGQCAWRAIVEAKQRSQWSVIGWVTKIYYLELFCALEGTFSR
jgi:hypothetical protein